MAGGSRPRAIHAITVYWFQLSGEFCCRVWLLSTSVYDAMWTAAHALHTLLYTNSTKNFSSSFPTIDDRVKFFDAIVETDFIGASGRVKFFADGDRSTKEIFYNILQVHDMENNHGQVIVSVGSFTTMVCQKRQLSRV